MHPITVLGGSGQRLVSAANLPIEISAGAPKRLRLFPEQPEGGQGLPSERDANGGILGENIKVRLVENSYICGLF